MRQTIKNNISQLRRKEAERFLFFRKFYFSHYYKCQDAPFHIELSEFLEHSSKVRDIKTAIAAPRDSAKSTIVSLQYVLYSICYQLEKFILLISNTSSQAADLLANVKKELETNERLKEDFPEVSEFGHNPRPPRWTKNEIITRNRIKVLALGTGQNIRGRRIGESRPSLIILDDIESDENFRNPESYDKLYDWVTKAVLKAGAAKTNVIFVGTIHHYHSLLARFTDPQGFSGWEKKIYGSVLSWSVNPKPWEEWVQIFNNQVEFKGESGTDAAKKYFEAHKEEMLEGTKVLWPQSKSYYDLMVLREQEGHYSFDSEMQNQPVNPRDCHFNLDELHYWDDKFKSEEELIALVGKKADFYGACDPSLGKKNKHGDYSAIVTALLDTESKKIYILDADIARRKPDKTIEDILAYHSTRKYYKFGFEVNQFQEYMADQLEKESKKEGDSLFLEKINNTKDKIARIEALQPLVKNGSVQFSRKHRTLLEQMKFFPKGSYDDGLDALEMVVNLCRNYSSRGVAYTCDLPMLRDSDNVTSYSSRIGGITIPGPSKPRRAPGF